MLPLKLLNVTIIDTMKNLYYLFLFTLLFQQTYAQHSIIPIPVSYQTTDDVFKIDSQLNLCLQTNNIQVKQYTELFQKF